MNERSTQRAATHEGILEAAGQMFREHGIENSGIGRIMGSIGLTVGGFYNHFESKEALLREVIEHTKSFVTDENDSMQAASESDGMTLQEILNIYLSAEHRDQPANGCLLQNSWYHIQADEVVQYAEDPLFFSSQYPRRRNARSRTVATRGNRPKYRR